MVPLKFNSVLYNNNLVLLYHKKTIALGRPWPDDKICPTGLAVDSQRKLLFAKNI